MVKENYVISFNCKLEHTSLVIQLMAEVELHHSKKYYVIKNFRTARNSSRTVLPNIEIKKLNGAWVHCDSEKESNLSMDVGAQIDAHESGFMQ